VAQQGVTEELYAHVASYRDHPQYSPAERMAIEFAERFAVDHTSMDEEFFGRLRAVLTDPEILDLAICVAAFLSLGRLLRVLGIDQTIVTDVT
jgi:alkylhydroperoxidase family enzyme